MKTRTLLLIAIAMTVLLTVVACGAAPSSAPVQPAPVAVTAAPPRSVTAVPTAIPTPTLVAAAILTIRKEANDNFTLIEPADEPVSWTTLSRTENVMTLFPLAKNWTGSFHGKYGPDAFLKYEDGKVTLTITITCSSWEMVGCSFGGIKNPPKFPKLDQTYKTQVKYQGTELFTWFRVNSGYTFNFATANAK